MVIPVFVPNRLWSLWTLSKNKQTKNNEQTPTLKETKLRLDTEIKTVDGLQEKLENGNLSCSDLHLAINIISCRIRDLRQMAVLKTEGLKKFKELDVYVISSIQSSLFQINDIVNNCLEINDRLCQQSAAMQGSLYRTGQSLQFEQQDNYVCISCIAHRANRMSITQTLAKTSLNYFFPKMNLDRSL